MNNQKEICDSCGQPLPEQYWSVTYSAFIDVTFKFCSPKCRQDHIETYYEPVKVLFT